MHRHSTKGWLLGIALMLLSTLTIVPDAAAANVNSGATFHVESNGRSHGTSETLAPVIMPETTSLQKGRLA